MNDKERIISCSISIAVVINIILPLIAQRYATKDEKSPPQKGGAKSLSFKGQIMHMLVHHAQVPFTSTLIVAVIVGLSVWLGFLCAKKIK